MNMKERYRLFLLRKSVYYAFDNTTKTFQSSKVRPVGTCHNSVKAHGPSASK